MSRMCIDSVSWCLEIMISLCMSWCTCSVLVSYWSHYFFKGWSSWVADGDPPLIRPLSREATEECWVAHMVADLRISITWQKKHWMMFTSSTVCQIFITVRFYVINALCLTYISIFHGPLWRTCDECLTLMNTWTSIYELQWSPFWEATPCLNATFPWNLPVSC